MQVSTRKSDFIETTPSGYSPQRFGEGRNRPPVSSPRERSDRWGRRREAPEGAAPTNRAPAPPPPPFGVLPPTLRWGEKQTTPAAKFKIQPGSADHFEMDVQPGGDPFGLPIEDDDPFAMVDRASLQPTPKRRAPLSAVAGFLLVLLVVGGGALAAKAWLSGTSQTAAEWIPASVDLYIGADLVRLQSEDLQTLLEAFGQPDGQSLIDDLDRQLRDQFGMTFENDIKPWLGRTIAFAGRFDPLFASDSLPGEILLALEVRDNDGADAFLDATAVDASLSEEPTGRGRLWSSGTDGLWLWHGDGVILIGDLAMIEEAMAMDPSASLAAAADFQTMTSKLRRSRAVTLYVDGSSLLSGSGYAPTGASTYDVGTAVAAIDFSSDGFVLDAIAPQPQYAGGIYDLGDGTDPFLASLDDQTVGFVRFGSASDIYDALVAGLDGTGLLTDGDGTVSLEQQLEDELGFDVVGDLVRKLDRPTGVAVRLHQDDTFGVVAAFGTTKPDEVKPAVDRLTSLIEDETGVTIGDLDGTGPADAVVGVTGQWLAIGSDRADVQMLTGTATSPLTGTPRYVQTVANLPEGEHVVAYVDIRSLLYRFGGEMNIPDGLYALTALAVGESTEGEYQRATFFLTVRGQAASSSSSDSSGSLAATGLTH